MTTPANYLPNSSKEVSHYGGRQRLKCDDTRAETRFRLSAKRTNPFKSAVASVQSTTGSRGVRISGSNAGHTMLRSSVKSTGYPLHSPVSSSLPLPCVTVCRNVSTGLYYLRYHIPYHSLTLHVTDNFVAFSEGVVRIWQPTVWKSEVLKHIPTFFYPAFQKLFNFK
jgi:hypothetical protein